MCTDRKISPTCFSSYGTQSLNLFLRLLKQNIYDTFSPLIPLFQSCIAARVRLKFSFLSCRQPGVHICTYVRYKYKHIQHKAVCTSFYILGSQRALPISLPLPLLCPLPPAPPLSVAIPPGWYHLYSSRGHSSSLGGSQLHPDVPHQKVQKIKATTILFSSPPKKAAAKHLPSNRTLLLTLKIADNIIIPYILKISYYHSVKRLFQNI